MKTFIIMLAFFFINYAKQEKSTNQNTDSVKTTAGMTENVKQTSQMVNQPAKNYKKRKPIELYDLIYMLLPGENDTTEVFNWNRGHETEAIRWEKEKYCWQESCSKSGDLNMAISGNRFKNEWSIYLHGNEKGWSAFGFGYSNIDFDYFDYDAKLEYFLNGNIFTTTILDEFEGQWILYEIKIPRKKVFWMKIGSTLAGNKGFQDFYIDCYLNKSESEKS